MTPFETALGAALHDAPVPLEGTCDRAFIAGARATTASEAFVAGYTEALHALLRNETFSRAAFAVTEDGGGHPSQLRTTLTWNGDHARLDGTKSFVTLAGEAERIYVVATEGLDAEGKAKLRLVGLAREGLVLQPGPRLPMLPEIEHARLVLDGVVVPAEAVLPGDAYLAYVKPFRTLEDIHVHAALVGHVLGLARRHGLGQPLQADAIATYATLRALALEPPLEPATHLALGGVLTGFERLLGAHDADLRRLPPEEHAHFERDIAIRHVASKARAQRLARAFEHFTRQPNPEGVGRRDTEDSNL